MSELKMYVCPMCGETQAMFTDLEKPCIICDVEMIALNMLLLDYVSMKKEDRDAYEKEVEEKIVFPHPLYSKEARARRFMLAEQLKKNPTSARLIYGSPNKSTIRCPHCGHDKFQMVARKWSLLTGFLTNKVDRVCERCKKRF